MSFLYPVLRKSSRVLLVYCAVTNMSMYNIITNMSMHNIITNGGCAVRQARGPSADGSDPSVDGWLVNQDQGPYCSYHGENV